MHHVHSPDPSQSIFFLPENLKLRNTTKIHFPKRELSDSLTHLLSKEEAETLPFSSQKLPLILRLFSFPSSSPQATAMTATLEECDRYPIPGEQKFCATSSQSMSEFIESIFGPDTPTKAVSTYHTKRSESDDVAVQNYRIMGIRRIPSPKMVSCHTMPYAYTVFYCHYHESDNRVYRVSLAGKNGDAVEAIAVCHMDTSQWGPNPVPFRSAISFRPITLFGSRLCLNKYEYHL